MPTPLRTIAALVVVLALLAGCGARAEAARRIRGMDATTATRHAFSAVERALAARATARDGPSAEAAAATMDLCAFEIERVALRIRELGPPPPGQQVEVAFQHASGLMATGLGSFHATLEAMARGNLEQVTATLKPADERLETAVERLQTALGKTR